MFIAMATSNLEGVFARLWSQKKNPDDKSVLIIRMPNGCNVLFK
jgi:hypothetical protein